MTARIVPLGGSEQASLHAAVAGDLLAFMGRHRISQRRLAAALNVDQSTVSRWLNKDMSVSELERLMGALGLTAKLTFRDSETGELTPPRIRMKLRTIQGDGHTTRVQSPLLARL